MKVTINCTLVLGDAKKQVTLSPGPDVVDTRKIGLTDDEARTMVLAGQLVEVNAEAKPATADPEATAGAPA